MWAGWLAGNGLVSKPGGAVITPIYSTRYGCAWQVAGCAGYRERAQAARLLHRRHLFVAGRLAL